MFPDYPLAQRQAIADRWFSSMFIRFKARPRLTFDSPFAGDGEKICDEIADSSGQLAFDGMLAEICSLIALFSEDATRSATTISGTPRSTGASTRRAWPRWRHAPACRLERQGYACVRRISRWRGDGRSGSSRRALIDSKTSASRSMKAVILAGGLGTRISEESYLKPKPMVEIGGRPILWHIMKIYSAHGVNDFVICCGYKGYVIKEYFANYFLHMSDVTFDMADNSMEVHQRQAEPWRVTLVDTGEDTHDRRAPQARGRLHRGRGGLLLHLWRRRQRRRHRRDRSNSTARHGKLATVTAVLPPGPLRRPASAAATAVTRLHREAARRRRPDQWRLLRAVAALPRSTSTATQTSWEGAPLIRLAADGRADGVRASRLLAADGHAARQEPARRALGSGQGAVEDLAM